MIPPSRTRLPRQPRVPGHSVAQRKTPPLPPTAPYRSVALAGAARGRAHGGGGHRATGDGRRRRADSPAQAAGSNPHPGRRAASAGWRGGVPARRWRRRAAGTRPSERRLPPPATPAPPPGRPPPPPACQCVEVGPPARLASLSAFCPAAPPRSALFPGPRDCRRRAGSPAQAARHRLDSARSRHGGRRPTAAFRRHADERQRAARQRLEKSARLVEANSGVLPGLRRAGARRRAPAARGACVEADGGVPAACQRRRFARTLPRAGTRRAPGGGLQRAGGVPAPLPLFVRRVGRGAVFRPKEPPIGAQCCHRCRCHRRARLALRWWRRRPAGIRPPPPLRWPPELSAPGCAAALSGPARRGRPPAALAPVLRVHASLYCGGGGGVSAAGIAPPELSAPGCAATLSEPRAAI